MLEHEDNPIITILYDGAYADRIKWREDKLAEFANKTDLRTYTYIVTGDDQQEHPQVSTLGDKLAWRNLLNYNPFSFTANITKSSVVEHYDSGDSDDEILSQQILS